MNEALTYISEFNSDSVIPKKKPFPKKLALSDTNYSFISTGSYSMSHSFSIELMRLGIRQKLNHQFLLQNDILEIDFLERNPQILDVIFEIKENIIKEFGTSEIALELQSESSSWETLFIVVSTNATWEKTNSFINQFFRKLFKSQPEVANMINLIIAPDAII